MTAVTAGRWDVRWDRGGDWTTSLARRTRSSVVLPMAAPSRMEVRPLDGPSTTPALLTLEATITPTGLAVLVATPAHMSTLPDERYEHRIVITDAATSRPKVLLRGYVTLLDTVGDG